MSQSMREALEAKRRKLEELKRKRAARRNRTTSTINTTSSTPTSASSSSAATPSAPASTRGTVSSTEDVLASVSSLIGPATTSAASAGGAAGGGGGGGGSGASGASGSGGAGAAAPRASAATLSTAVVEVLNIAAVETVTYERGVQAGGESGDADAEVDEVGEEVERKRAEAERLRVKAREEEEKRLEEQRKQREADELARRVLSQEAKQSIKLSQDFQAFLARTSVVIERTLAQNEDFDVTKDYTKQAKTVKSAEVYRNKHVFTTDKTFNRPVTGIDWSSRHGELFLTSYADNTDQLSLDPDGMVLLWNQHMRNRPEMQFYCQSAVLTAQFHPTEPHMIVGGTQSGQLVMWDMREAKPSPVTRTTLAHGHVHPLFGLDSTTLTAGHTAASFVTASTDGHLCVWSDDNFDQPSSSLRLENRRAADAASGAAKDAARTEVGPNSVAIVPGPSLNKIYLGSDEGTLYEVELNDDAGIVGSAPQAHFAPITQVQFHPWMQRTGGASHKCFLTSSCDWTVKLWSFPLSPTPLLEIPGGRDYVYDVQWSPAHPSLFALGDGTGAVHFWDLNKATDRPASSANVLDSGSAISRLKWSKHGKRLAVGASDGSVHVLSLDKDLITPSDTAEEDFARTLEVLRSSTM